MCEKQAEGPSPVPREMPKSGGFALPHRELFDDVQRLIGQLDEAVKVGSELREAFTATGTEILPRLARADLEAQMYSRAIQVFAAMAAEAALNAYGLMWFGEADFERHFEWKNPTKKIKALARAVLKRELTVADEVVGLLDSLQRKRNAHVHLRAEEAALGSDGVLQLVTAGHVPRRDPSGGLEAASELRRFLELFADLDGRTRSFFAIFDLAKTPEP